VAITIDWGTKVINIPRADLQLVQSVPNEVRQLDIDDFRRTLNDLQDDAVGMPYPTTHQHVQPVTVGGVTLARVVEVINGYTLTFEDGIYAVNLSGANSNLADVTNLNSVSLRTANSAGLTFSEQINQQSFNGHVWVDTTEGLSGTQFPRGTPSDPVNNWADADIIADGLKLESFKLRNTLVMPVGENLDGYTIEGTNTVGSQISFQGGQMHQLDLINLSFGGLMGEGFFIANRCMVGILIDFEGALNECVLNGDITLDATPLASNDILFINCASGIPGDDRFDLDCNGTTSNIQFRNFSGGVGISNFTAGNKISVDFNQGKIVIDASCTAGTILVRGIAEIVDNSGPGCTVLTTGTVTNLVAAGTITDQDKADIANRIIPQIWAAS